MGKEIREEGEREMDGMRIRKGSERVLWGRGKGDEGEEWDKK